jgi:L-iditol 2-dehydrogenase
MKIPKKMKASYLLEPGKVELREIPVPVPGAGEVLVRIDAVGSCGSDTHFYKSGAIGDLVVESPIILGHEAAGTVAAVGEGVSEERVNKLVSIEPQKPCRSCEYCKRGDYHLCPAMEFYGAWPIDGAFSEYAVIDSDFAHDVPPNMNAEQAALVEPASVAVHACRRAGVTPGSSVFITGAGPIGVMITQVARAFGATRIAVSDPAEPRRQFVLGLGADELIDPLNDDLSVFEDQFDIYIDASGNAGAILSALPVIRRGGVAMLVGMGVNDLQLPLAHLQHREITLSGTYRYVNTWPTAISLIATGAIITEGLVTSRHGLDDVENAMLNASRDPRAIKAMVIPGLFRAE